MRRGTLWDPWIGIMGFSRLATNNEFHEPTLKEEFDNCAYAVCVCVCTRKRKKERESKKEREGGGILNPQSCQKNSDLVRFSEMGQAETLSALPHMQNQLTYF